MTVGEVISFVDSIKPNAFTDEVKIRRISQLEGKLAAEVFIMAVEELKAFNYSKLPKDEAKSTELLVDAPYDDIYTAYLTAQIDYANGEYDKYANTFRTFNEKLNGFVAWFAGTYRPADSYYFPHLTKGGEDHGHV